MAHEIPYVATATVADLRDLEAQGRARDELPRRALPARARPLPARLGLGAARTRSRSRAWPRRPACSRCSRPSTATVTARLADPPPRARSRSTCARRAATRTCSAPSAAQRRDRAPPGASPTATSSASACSTRRSASGAVELPQERVMEKPFAITLDVGSSLANHTGSWRDRAPRLRRPPAALQRRAARRARTSRAGCTTPRRRRLRGGVAPARAATTRSPR